MKKWLSVFLACAMCVMLATGCVGNKQTDEELMKIAADLIDKATELHFVYHCEPTSAESLPKGTEVTVNGVKATLPWDFVLYEHSSELLGEIKTFEDLCNVTLGVYTEDIARRWPLDSYYNYKDGEELPKFIGHNGKLYVGVGGQGIRYLYNVDTIKIQERQADTVLFHIFYEDYDYSGDKQELVDRETHEFVMKKTKNGWRLDTFYSEKPLAQ